MPGIKEIAAPAGASGIDGIADKSPWLIGDALVDEITARRDRDRSPRHMEREVLPCATAKTAPHRRRDRARCPRALDSARGLQPVRTQQRRAFFWHGENKKSPAV